MLSKDFKKFIKLLNDQKVEYLLVGGYAVVLYGYVRYTGDIDFWINSSRANAGKILDVLQSFGFSSLNLGIEDFTDDDQIVQLGYPPNRIDIISSVSGLNFSECFPKRSEFVVDGIPIKAISLEDLKKNKEASGRHKDLDDLANLK